jgi:hypothetical protein
MIDEPQPESGFVHLESRPGRFRQLFVKGRRYRADRIYRESIGEAARTPDELARDFDLPIAAVKEAIAYCVANESLVLQERDEEIQRIRDLQQRHSSGTGPRLKTGS